MFAGPFGILKIMFRFRIARLYDNDLNPWGKNGCYYELIGMPISTVVLILITLMAGNNVCKKTERARVSQNKTGAENKDADSDVLAEIKRVKDEKGSDLISVDELKKEFIVSENKQDLQDAFENQNNANDGVLRAVRGISFGLK